MSGDSGRFNGAYGDGSALRNSITELHVSVTEAAKALSLQARNAKESRRIVEASGARIQLAREALASAQGDLRRRSSEVEQPENSMKSLSREAASSPWRGGLHTPRSRQKDMFWSRPTTAPPCKRLAKAELEASVQRLASPPLHHHSLGRSPSEGDKDVAATFPLARDKPWRAGAAPDPKDVFRWSHPLGLPYFDPPTKKLDKPALEEAIKRIAKLPSRWQALAPVKPQMNEGAVPFADLDLGTAAAKAQQKKERKPWRAGTTHKAPDREYPKPKKLHTGIASIGKRVEPAPERTSDGPVEREKSHGSSEPRAEWKVPGLAPERMLPPNPITRKSPPTEQERAVRVPFSLRYPESDFR